MRLSPTMSAGSLVLASTSEARSRLLGRLGHTFVAVAPTCDEAALHGRTPDETASLRAFAKAESVRGLFPREAWIIGSDQVVDLDGQILGKPETTERACAQLAELSGRTHRLVTAVVVLGPDVRETRLVVSRLTMRLLEAAEIAAYVATDAPEACAGSYKIECTGRALFSQIVTSDETAIEGLPLVALSGMLGPLLDGGLSDGGRRGGVATSRRSGSPPSASPAP